MTEPRARWGEYPLVIIPWSVLAHDPEWRAAVEAVKARRVATDVLKYMPQESR